MLASPLLLVVLVLPFSLVSFFCWSSVCVLRLVIFVPAAPSGLAVWFVADFLPPEIGCRWRSSPSSRLPLLSGRRAQASPPSSLSAFALPLPVWSLCWTWSAPSQPAALEHIGGNLVVLGFASPRLPTRPSPPSPRKRRPTRRHAPSSSPRRCRPTRRHAPSCTRPCCLVTAGIWAAGWSGVRLGDRSGVRTIACLPLSVSLSILVPFPLPVPVPRFIPLRPCRGEPRCASQRPPLFLCR